MSGQDSVQTLTIGHSFPLEFREEIIIRANAQSDPEFVELAARVNLETRTASVRVAKIVKPYLLLRFILALSVVGVLAGFGWYVYLNRHYITKADFKEVLEVSAKVGQLLVAAPLILSLLLVEIRMKRARLLKALRTLEELNDNVYQIQFNHNIVEVADRAALMKYLTCCCGLLFLIREAAGQYSEGVSDAVVLERVANIRRGSNDNHRNILMKMAMASQSPVSP